MLGVAWPTMRDGFGLKQDAVGLLYVTVSIAYFAASFISGRLIARYGIALPFIFSAALGAIGLLGYTLSPAWEFIVLLGFVVGFGGGLLDAGMNILFAANYGARLMNWLHASFGIGMTIGPALMTAILNAGGSWKTGYIIVAGLYACLAVIFGVTRHWWKVSGQHSSTTSPAGATAIATLRLPLVWLGIGFFLAYAGLESSAGQWSFSLFSESRHVAGDVAGIWVSAFTLSFTVGRIFFGFIVNRFKTVSMIRLCLGGVILGMVVLWWNPTTVLGFVGLLLFGFTLAPIFALMITSLQDRLGSRHGPNAIGFSVAAASFGAGLLPGLAGVLAKSVSLEIVPPFLLVFCVLMAVLYEAIISPRVPVPSAAVPAGD
jgi:fucose permease